MTGLPWLSLASFAPREGGGGGGKRGRREGAGEEGREKEQ